MMTPERLNINTEIRIADILVLFNQKTVKHFICHHVAFMLQDQLRKVPGFESFCRYCREFEYESVPQYQSIEEAEFEIRSTYFYFLHRNYKSELDTQVVSQLNQWYARIYGDMEFAESYIHDLQWAVIAPCRVREPGLDYLRRCRVVLLEKILELDPHAVLSIKL